MKKTSKKKRHLLEEPVYAITPDAYHGLITDAMRRLTPKVTHVNPADIDYAALDVSIAQAQAKNRRR